MYTKINKHTFNFELKDNLRTYARTFKQFFSTKAKQYADHLNCHSTTLSQTVLGPITNVTPRRKNIKLNFNILFLSNPKQPVYQRPTNANYIALYFYTRNISSNINYEGISCNVYIATSVTHRKIGTKLHR